MKTMEEVYKELLGSDELQTRMMEAAVSGGIEKFFGELGCSAAEEEIWEYFRCQILRRGELSEEELEAVSGGACGRCDIEQMLRIWSAHLNI